MKIAETPKDGLKEYTKADPYNMLGTDALFHVHRKSRIFMRR